MKGIRKTFINRRNKNPKGSIARQLTAIFILLSLLVMGAFVLANSLFLEKYYTRQMQSNLVKIYEQLNEAVTENGVEQEKLSGPFMEMFNIYNVNLVVTDDQYQVLIGNNGVMAGRIFGYINGLEQEQGEILAETDDYTIQKKNDDRLNMAFLEMWGTLDSGAYFLLRIPLSSIKANAGISTRFALYVALAAAFAGALIITFVSHRIAKPVKELTALSERMSNLDFDAKYTSGGSNEIGQLGENFNKMSATLETTISELKTSNAKLQREIEQKTQIDEMRKEFLSNVSHELKTPLALISGYAEGLQENINDDPESRNFYCEVIMDEAGKMTSMVQKLLSLNELEFGRDKVNLQRFDLVQLVKGKINSTQILADQKDAGLHYDGPEVLHVWGDEFKIEEVLTNYLSNALNHVDGKRQIRVSTKQQDGKVRVSVYNDGTPIPQEDLEKIWVKFFKVDKARTREYGGSGVGLSIVKAIMDSHHQKFGVCNHEEGVEFWFELEAAEGQLAKNTDTKDAEHESD